MGKLTYFIVDQTDPLDEFECEGEVIQKFFQTSAIIDFRKSKILFRSKKELGAEILQGPRGFNIFHLAAHGDYAGKTTNQLDYTAIYQRSRGREREIFRPDTIVRSELSADLFVSTCCRTFNNPFVEVINGYGKVRNYIAPMGEPLIGDTIVFSVMFYNALLRRISKSQKAIKDGEIVKAFSVSNEAYEKYKGKGDFRLYNCPTRNIYS